MRRKLATLPRAQVIIDQLINLRALRGGEVTYVERHGVTDCLAVGRKLPGAFGGHAAQFVRDIQARLPVPAGLDLEPLEFFFRRQIVCSREQQMVQADKGQKTKPKKTPDERKR